MFHDNLPKEVNSFLKKQAKLNEKSEKIIDLFLKQHGKTEIVCLVDFIVSSGAPKHAEAINEFKQNYEQNHLSVKDVEIYLNMLDIHKSKMKEKKIDNEKEDVLNNSNLKNMGEVYE